MSTTISGSNAISGLGGADTNFDEVLAKLKQVESTQLNRLEAWKSDWQLRYDAFGEVIDQITAAKNMLTTLTNRNNFVTKNVVSSDSNVITAVANASADDVQHTINVTQMASNAIWANTGHVFSSKTDIINDTDATQVFSCTYGGRDYSLNVPKNTTLDSFVSMVNSDANNPGIKISLVQTGGGYVFQVAGKDTGVNKDLVIHNTNLVGMDATNTHSLWESNATVDMGASVTDPTAYAYDILMADGGRFTATIAGDKTNADLARAINAKVGREVAAIDSDGNLSLNGVTALYRRDAGEVPSFSLPSATLTLGSGTSLNATIDEDIRVSLLVNDGNTTSRREIAIAAGTTRKEAAWAIAQAANISSPEMGITGSGMWELSLSGVEGVSFLSADTGTEVDTGISVRYDEGSMGERVTGSGSAGLAASARITFDPDMLDSQLAGSEADPDKSFSYTIVGANGTVKTLDPLPQNATYRDLMNALIAQDAFNVTEADGVVTLEGASGFYLSGGGTGGGMDGLSVRVDATSTIAGMDADATLEDPPDLEYTIMTNAQGTVSFSLAGGSSMAKIVKTMQEHGLAVSLADADGNTVDITDAMSEDDIAALGAGWTLQLTDVNSVSGPGVSGQITTSDNWSIQRAASAKFQIDNWPVEMESASNSVSDALEGVVFSIQGTGSANITVSTDITSVEQSIQNFLDAVNSVLITVRDLTAYDADKAVTTSDPEKIGSSNYSTSQLTSEKGGLLMGNYGVQLFSSRFKSLLGSAPAGFTSRADASDILSGDVLANLANMGIKMDTDQSSNTYGLLSIAPSSSIASMQELDLSNYENMINNHLADVVDFFCTSGTGASTSSDFRYGSHISGITKAGIYDVEYTVDADGNIAHVYVGDVEAVRDTSQPGYYFNVASGDARGLAFQIDNLSEGTHTGQMRIKEGMVQSVSTFLTAELKFTDVNVSGQAGASGDAIALKSENGALMVLRDNYKTIMANIDKKISQEQIRISQWESRQKTYFANLETLLKQYSEQESRLKAQISSLSTGSSN